MCVILRGMAKRRIRVQRLEMVRSGGLTEDPRNWRRHSEGQRTALSSMLDRHGWADAVIARETADGYVLVDGHLRADLDPEEVIPTLIVDLDAQEAGEVLATLDPLASMAETDHDALEALMKEIPEGTLDPVMHGTLQDLLDDSEWGYDAEAMDALEPSSEGLLKTFKVKCPAGMSTTVSAALSKIAEQYPGVTVE